jgi:hypothetical protein
MLHFSSVFQWFMAPADLCLEFAVLFIAFRRRLQTQLPIFSTYLILVTISEIMGWWVSFTPWFYSDRYLYVYWSYQFILSLLRLLTIAEIARRSLRGYPAVWTFGWRVLLATGLLLLSWTAYSATQSRHHIRRFVAVGGQRFELMQAILLLVLLLLGAYYRVQISQLYRSILIGICIYSAVQVANNQILFLNQLPADSIFGYIRRSSFLVALVIWTYAVWRWGASKQTEPQPITQTVYDDLAPQVHDHLRDLNDKLANLVGKRRR